MHQPGDPGLRPGAGPFPMNPALAQPTTTTPPPSPALRRCAGGGQATRPAGRPPSTSTKPWPTGTGSSPASTPSAPPTSKPNSTRCCSRPSRRSPACSAGRTTPAVWSTPGLVETRFSPDALVWVAVVFHGTAAWRNHGLIIFPLLFYRTSVQLRCPAAPPGGGLRPPGPPPGLGHLLVGHPLCAAGSPGGARVTRSVIACDAGGALDLGGGSVAPVPRPARRCPPAAAPVLTCRAISEEGRGPGRSPGGCGRSPPG